jgi:hypothetical protein
MSGAFFIGGLDALGMSRTALPVRLFLAARNVVLRRADVYVAITSRDWNARSATCHGIHAFGPH